MSRERPGGFGTDPLAGLDPDKLAGLLGEREPRGRPEEAARGDDAPTSEEDARGGRQEELTLEEERRARAARPVPEDEEPETGADSPAEVGAPEAGGDAESPETPPATIPGAARDLPTLLAGADELLERGHVRRAIERLARARARAPDDVGVMVRLARAHAALGAYPEAAQAIDHALRLEPKHAEARCERGIILMKKGLYDEAVAELERAVALRPDQGEALYALGFCHNRFDRLDAAAEAYQRAIEAAPEDPRAWYQLGVVYDRKGMPEEALEMYRRAREVREAAGG